MEEDLKKFLGLPPYNDSCNISCGDNYFYQSLVEKYGKLQVEQGIEKIKESNLM